VVEDERSGQPTIHLLQTDHAKSVETPLGPYISKGFDLVIVAQVKPYRESRVESSIHSSFGSSLGDR
jgi:hypothetical protein